MSEQYFTANPQTKSDQKTWSYTLKGHAFTFTSDGGVFSKNDVDFGSRTLIEAYQSPDVPGDILDLGCGYGPIGLSLAKVYPERTIHLSDVNMRALELAEKNAKANQVTNVQFHLSDIFEKISEDNFASILTNPPIRAGKQTVHQMFEDSFEHLKIGGTLWVVIQKKQGAPSAIKKLETLFATVDLVTKNKGYFIIRAEK
ncbi:16S rRNA m(2)G 1207 methyltransferase [Streptohalobacillus salinus]|uniref:16S rRNA m(2)G 1207 methyltransferase n=1 Tax=Streptohalobacillus salinus TaxID=621096 RepID=A0A2V3W3S4_9BACI|nr:class I SAM-dependent methyltransferase [Streptohalobacillus salinus]PXW87731.1 16S rRNA m(2)G 1207 methyltransferase [Streptohalobacillus salinus]